MFLLIFTFLHPIDIKSTKLNYQEKKVAIPDHIKNNLSIPVIGSPLFLVSGPELVIAQCKAGIIGSFPALNARPQHVLEEWIVRIKTELA